MTKMLPGIIKIAMRELANGSQTLFLEESDDLTRVFELIPNAPERVAAVVRPLREVVQEAGRKWEGPGSPCRTGDEWMKSY